MSIYSSYERFHWRAFNALARLFGIMAMLFAINSIAAGVYYLLYPTAADDAAMSGFSASGVSLVVGVVSAAIGLAVLWIGPYRPDLGDSTWTFGRSPAHGAPKRNWWTGDMKAGHRSRE